MSGLKVPLLVGNSEEWCKSLRLILNRMGVLVKVEEESAMAVGERLEVEE